MVKHLAVVVLLLSCLPSFALGANRYIRDGAAGLSNGSSWADAWPTLSAVTWTRGDTYYLAGGNYAAAVISSPVSGGLWITIKKANNTDNSGDAGWNPTYATTQAVVNGVVSLVGNLIEIDGVTGSGLSGHGIKFTLLPNSTTLTASFVQPAMDSTVTITVASTATLIPGSAVHIPNGGGLSGGYYSITSISSGTTALVKLINNTGVTNDTLAPTGSVIAAGVAITGDGTSLAGLRMAGVESGGYRFYHLEMRNFAYNSWQSGNALHDSSATKKGVHVAYCWLHEASNNGATFNNCQGTSYSDYGLLFENNHVTETGGATDGGHGQGMKFQGSNTYCIIRNNVFRNNSGTGTIVFLDSPAEIHTFFRIHNNILYKDDLANFPGTSPAVIYGKDNCTTSNFEISNNTFWGYGNPSNTSSVSQCILAGNPALGGASVGNSLINNIFENGYWTSGGNSGFATVLNNVYFNNTGNSGGASIPSGTPGQINSAASNFVNAAAADFHLVLSSPAVDAGSDRSASFTTDIDGVTRPKGVAWDIGAYELIQTNPSVFTHPAASPFAAFGATVNLTVVARGQAPLNFQWKKNGVNLADGAGPGGVVVSGATTATLTLTGVSAVDQDTYAVEVNNVLGPLATSNNSVLTVGAGVAPNITAQPAASQTVLLGATVQFTAAANGTPAPSFQWKKNSVNLANGAAAGGVVVSGATTATLTLTGVTGVDAGTYTVVADNTVAPAATSNNAVLIVSGVPLGVATHPASQSVALGAPVTFSVVATGNAPLTYQWVKNGGAITGATSGSYSIPAAQAGDAGDYYVIVSNASGSVSSNTATLVVILPPTISSPPVAAKVSSGRNASFQVTASGGSSYQWQVSSNGGTTWSALGNNSTYGGTSTNILSISNAQDDLNGLSYRVLVTNGGGTVASSAAVLSVLTPVFVTPVDVAVTANGTLLVSDSAKNVIQSVSPAGQASVLAGFANLQGSGDGTGTFAQFRMPGFVVRDAAGNLYVADTGNSVIRKVTPDGTVTTLAGSASGQGFRDGIGSDAWFSTPVGITIDAAGNLYVADTGNSVIRKIATNGTVTTLAGSPEVRGSTNGAGADARFNQPTGITIDGTGNLLVADSLNQIIRRINPAGVVTTFAGLAGVAGADDGNATTTALFNRPSGVAVDASGNVYVSDTGNSTIRIIRTNGTVATLAGVPTISGFQDGTGLGALFNQPLGLRLDGTGNLYVADSGNAMIRRMTVAGVTSTLTLTEAPAPAAPATPTPTPTPTPIPTPPTNIGGGGGGGGAPSAWFLLALVAAGALRYRAGLLRRQS